MVNKIILFSTLLTYSFIVSQSFMYMLSLKKVQMNLGVSSYIEFRKLVDSAMRASFKYVLYATLILNLALVLSNIKNPGSLLFITSAVALVALVVDILLTVKGNLPVNDIINAWSVEKYPADWKTYRDKWFTIFQYRQVANITGFVSLLVGAVFGSG